MTATLRHIYRYPVKGMTAEPLDAVALAAGNAMSGDRRFAIAHAAAQIDATRPEWRPKSDFVMLARHPRLALLECRFDPDTSVLSIFRDGKQVARADTGTPMSRAVIEQFFSAFLAEETRGRARLVQAAESAFTDVPERWLSLINLASVADLERVVRAPVDPLRFRGNLYVDGLAPWEEFSWIGREIGIDGVTLRVEERIERCAATHVDPKTATRDLNILKSLQQGFGHVDMGLYVSVLTGGTIRPGMPLTRPS